MKTHGNWQGVPVVITGGAGFIGSNLAREMVHRGARVRVVDNLERGRTAFLSSIWQDVEFIRADLRHPEEAARAVRGADTVFHLAAQVGGIRVYQDRAGTVLNNNLLIDQHVFAAVVAGEVPRFFYASSAHVYPRRLQQFPDSLPLKESDADPADPVLSYGWGKRIGEVSLLSLAAEYPWMKVAIARIMGAYGYNQDFGLATGSVIPVFCHRAIRWPAGAPFRIWGSGRETRSYIFIDDVVEGVVRSVEALTQQPIVGPLNLAADGRVTIHEIAESIVHISGKQIPLEFESTAPTAIWGQAADTSLARSLLDGWHAQTTFNAGLQATYRDVARRLLKANGSELLE
jgi:GDP-D-mannose 3',5'-epimerase